MEIIHVGWVTEMLWNNIGFYDIGDDGNSGGGGGGGHNYRNYCGMSSLDILGSMKFEKSLAKTERENLDFGLHLQMMELMVMDMGILEVSWLEQNGLHIYPLKKYGSWFGNVILAKEMSVT